VLNEERVWHIASVICFLLNKLKYLDMKFSKEQIKYIKELAKPLVDDGENAEYTRGICELIADLDGVEDVQHEDRSEEIRQELLNCI
jgi:hypothetical protein